MGEHPGRPDRWSLLFAYRLINGIAIGLCTRKIEESSVSRVNSVCVFRSKPLRLLISANIARHRAF